MTDPLISAVIPVFNERDNIDELIRQVAAALAAITAAYEIVLVDDGSSDDTAVLLEAAAQADARIHPVLLARNYGQSTALQAGFDAARGRLIATMDGDLQNDPADLPLMVKVLDETGADVVSGRRAARNDGGVRKAFSRAANTLIRKTTGIKERDFGCSLRVFRREIVERIRVTGEMHRFMPALLQDVGAKVVEVDVNHRPRTAGASKYGLDRTVRVLLDLVLILFLRKYLQRPLHVFGGAGLMCLIPGGLILVYLVGVKVLLGADIGDRPLLMAGVLLVVTGVTLVGQGLLGELVTRILQDTGKRPQYHLRPDRTPLGLTIRDDG